MFYLIFIINHILACLLNFTPQSNRDQKTTTINIDQELFMISAWTRYYTFYSNESISNSAQIFRASSQSIDQLILYDMEITDLGITHIITFQIDDNQLAYSYQIDGQQYEGVWILLYIKFDREEQKIYTYLLNQKTTISQQLFDGPLEDINFIYNYHYLTDKYKSFFPTRLKFYLTINSKLTIICNLVKLLMFVQHKNEQNLITQRDQFNNTPYSVIQHDGFWIDGWFKLHTQQQHYFPILLKIIQYDRDNEKYNGMTPLYIELRYNQDNLLDNGFYVYTQHYTLPRWYDQPLNQQLTQILDKQYNSQIIRLGLFQILLIII
ncbi:hypothetical protein pb186bvf_009362 [Paramecium bursaria]